VQYPTVRHLKDDSNFVQDISSGMSDKARDALDTITGSSPEMADEYTGRYMLNEENQWGWITLYVVTIVIAILGNLLFVVASLCTKRTRTTGE